MSPYYQRGGVTLYLGDCREVMAGMADKSIDHVITDPPYSEHVHEKSRSGSAKVCNNPQRGVRKPSAKLKSLAGGYVHDLKFAHITDDLRTAAASECARLTLRWSLAFCDVEQAHRWIGAFTDAGLDYARTGAWVKLGGTPQFTGDRPSTGFEAIVIAHQPGRKRWNGGGSQGVWIEPIAHYSQDRFHTTQKPIALMRKLIALFTDPGELVLDPFAGSCTTLAACIEQGRRAIGVEFDEAMCEKAAKRLDAMLNQGNLFAKEGT